MTLDYGKIDRKILKNSDRGHYHFFFNRQATLGTPRQGPLHNLNTPTTHHKEERVGIGPQFLDEPLLEPAERLLLLLDGRVDLLRGEEEVLTEGEAQHVQVLPAIAEGGQHMGVHLAVLEVLRVHQHHAICKQGKGSLKVFG